MRGGRRRPHRLGQIGAPIERVVLNPAHPLAKELRSLFIVGQNAGGQDLVNLAPWTATDAATLSMDTTAANQPVINPTQVGPAWTFDGSNDSAWKAGQAGIDPLNTPAFTVAVLARVPTFPAATSCLLSFNSGTDVNITVELTVRSTPRTRIIATPNLNTTSTVCDIAATPTAGGWALYVATFDDITHARLSFFDYTTNSLTSATGSAGSIANWTGKSFTREFWGSQKLGTDPAAGFLACDIAASWVWGRALAADEITGLARDPFGMVQPKRRMRSLTAGATDATVNLTGVAGAGSVGTVVPTVVPTVTGVSGSGAAGTAVPTVAKAVTGVAGAGAVGTVSVKLDSTATLTGVAGTGSVGTVTPTVAPTVTGVAGAGQVGTVTPTVAPTVTGAAGAGAVGTVVPTVIPTMTGAAGTGAAGTVTVSTASVTTVNLTGVAGTGAAGTLAPTVAVTPAGVAGTGAVGTVAPTIAPTVTGAAGAGAAGTVAPVVAVTPSGVAGAGAAGDVTITTTGDKIVNLIGVEGIGQVGTLTVQADAPIVAGPGALALAIASSRKPKGRRKLEEEYEEHPVPVPEDVPEEVPAITYDTRIAAHERAMDGLEGRARAALERKRAILIRERERARRAAEDDDDDAIILMFS